MHPFGVLKYLQTSGNFFLPFELEDVDDARDNVLAVLTTLSGLPVIERLGAGTEGAAIVAYVGTGEATSFSLEADWLLGLHSPASAESVELGDDGDDGDLSPSSWVDTMSFDGGEDAAFASEPCAGYSTFTF